MKVVFKDCPAPKLDESGAAKCTGHHKKMAKEVKKLADGCAGDSKAANVEPEKMADDYEKNFCLICQSEAETNAHFAEEHCATIVRVHHCTRGIVHLYSKPCILAGLYMHDSWLHLMGHTLAVHVERNMKRS
jgi:hypothetical protein